MPSTQKSSLNVSYGKLPLSFEANQGQSDKHIKFLSHGNGYSLFLTDKDAVLVLKKNDPGPFAAHAKSNPAKTDVVRMELAGSNPALGVAGAEQLEGTANYFIGNDPSRWRSNVPTYAKVKYSGVYPGIDLLYYGNQRQLEYDFVVAPGADPRPVRLHFAGARKLTLNSDGDLTVSASHGEVDFHKPTVYQSIDGHRQPIEGRFTLLAGNTVGFSLGAYDRSRELVIDPVLAYSTYLGGEATDVINGIAVDSAGNAYVVGTTSSDHFPVTGSGFQRTNKAPATFNNVFVTKLNAAGTALIYSTYLGGSNSNGGTFVGANPLYNGDSGNSVAVDASGYAFVAGTTYSSDFPVTPGAFQPTPGAHGSAFVTKLSPSGSALVYSTYLSGTANARGTAIALDAAGEAYVAGVVYVNSLVGDSGFPVTTGAYQTVSSTFDNLFITKFNAEGSALVYSTLLGTAFDDCDTNLVALAVDNQGQAYVTGTTESIDMHTTPNAFQTVNKEVGADVPCTGFVMKFNATGSGQIFSTYLGGSGANDDDHDQGFDHAIAIAVDSVGNSYVAGNTTSLDFPTTPGTIGWGYEDDGTQTRVPFVTKFDPTGTTAIYSTYASAVDFSSSLSEIATSMALDSYGHVYLAYLPVYQAGFGPPSPVLVELNKAGSALLINGWTASTIPAASTIAVDKLGNVYLAGSVGASGMTVTAGAFQRTYTAPTNGGNTTYSNGFVAKFAYIGGTFTSLVSSNKLQASGTNVTFTAHVKPASGSNLPNGTVRFLVDGAVADNVELDSNADATFSTTTLTIGSHAIVATYFGDPAAFSSSSAGWTQTIVAQTSPPVAQISTTSLQFGSIKYPATETKSLTITNVGGGTLIISTSINGPDYSISGTTCSAGLTLGNFCTLQVLYSPTQPGLQNELLTINNNGATNPVVSLMGSATAGAAFAYTQKDLAANLVANLVGVATDASGNVFFANVISNSVNEILAVNGSIPADPTIRTLAGGLVTPDAIAVDARGNVYVTDTYDNHVTSAGAVKEILAVNGSIPANPTVRTLASGINGPGGVVVDAKGDVILTVSQDGAVKELVAVNGSVPANPTIKTLGSGFITPVGLALDLKGNLYVADDFTNQVKELLAVDGSIPVAPTIRILNPLGSLNAPQGVAVDAKGDVYVASQNGIQEILALNGAIPASNPTIVSLGSDLFEPQAVAVDQKGDIFFTDQPKQNGTVLTELQPGPLQYGSIPLPGTESLPLLITNIGDDILPISPSINGPSYTITGNTCGDEEAVGDTCTLQVRYAPVQVGLHDDVLTLNNSGTTAPMVGLFGFATGISADAADLKTSATGQNLVFGTIPASSYESLSLKFHNEGVSGQVKLGISINGPSYTIPDATNGCLAGIQNGQDCSLLVVYKPIGTGLHDDRLTITPSAGALAFHIGLIGSAD